MLLVSSATSIIFAIYSITVSSTNSGTFSEPSEPTSPVICRDELEPPYVDYDPKLRDALVVKAGDAIHFDAKIYGKPPPAVRWTRNGKDLNPTPQLKIERTPTHASINVSDSSRKDTGMFCLVYFLAM